MLVQVLATAFVAGFVGVAVLGHLLIILTGLLPRVERSPTLQTQS